MNYGEIAIRIGEMFVPLTGMELQNMPFKKMVFIPSGWQMLINNGYVYATVEPRYAGLHTMSLRGDNTLTFSVKSNPGRMYSVHVSQLTKWHMVSAKGLIKGIGRDIRIAMELDCLDDLIDSLEMDFEPYQGYKLLISTNAINIMQYLQQLHKLHPAAAVRSKSIGRRLITTLKRLNVIEYNAESKSKFIYSGPYMDVGLCEYTVKRQLFIHSK